MSKSKHSAARVAAKNESNVTAIATIGAFVWSTTQQERVRVDRALLRQRVQDAGLPVDALVGDDPTPQGCLGRAKGTWRQKDRHRYVLGRPEKGARGKVTIERRDGERLDAEQRVCALVEFDDQAQLRCVQGPAWDSEAGRIFTELQAAFNEHRDYANASELRMVVTRAVTEWFGGCRIRSEGHAYWVPNSAVPQMTQLAKALTGLGYYTFVAPIADTRGARDGVRHGMAESFIDEAQRVLKKLRERRDKMREATAAAHLEELMHLRDLASGYADILEAKQREVLDEIQAAEDAAREVLGEGTGAVDTDAEVEEAFA